MKKLLTAALSVLMLTTSLFSCMGKPDNVTSGEADATEPRASNADDIETTDPMADNLPDINFDSAEYTILGACEQWVNEYYVESMTGDIVNDVIYDRNRTIEERFNLKLNYVIKNGWGAGKADISTALKGSVMSGSGDYDLSIINAAYVSDRIVEGVFTDLNQLDYLDFSRDWWLVNVNKQLMINNKLYVATGKYSIGSLIQNWAMFFNKKLVSDYKLETPYKFVEDGTWIYDKMLEYTSGITTDLDGSGTFDDKDLYAILGTNTEPFWAFPVGMGRKITVTDSDGLPQLTGDDERISTIYDRLLALYNDKTRYFGTVSEDINNGLLQMFTSNQALFMVYNISITSAPEMREVEDFGIIPLPKYDEKQEAYLSNCFSDTYAIPKEAGFGLDNSALVLEALNAESHRSVIPQYYNIALTRKYTRDNDSEKMLDIICKGASLDFGTIFFTQLDIKMLMIGELFKENVTSYSTWWAANNEIINTKLEEIVENITSME